MTQPPMADGVPGRQHLTGYRLTGYDDLIAKLAASRESQDLSQRQLAARLGVLQTSLSGWLSGRTSCNRGRLFALADALGYDLALVPNDQPTACDCGHDGLDAMFHLSPCPIALLRRQARKLGYDLALIPREDAP